MLFLLFWWLDRHTKKRYLFENTSFKFAWNIYVIKFATINQMPKLSQCNTEFCGQLIQVPKYIHIDFDVGVWVGSREVIRKWFYFFLLEEWGFFTWNHRWHILSANPMSLLILRKVSCYYLYFNFLIIQIDLI